MYIHFKCTALSCTRVCLMQGRVTERGNNGRGAGTESRQGLPGPLLMNPLANYCSLPELLPVLPVLHPCPRMAIPNPLFLHRHPLLPSGSPG